MKTALVYPYVVPKADQFRDDMHRFCRTLGEFPAGADYDLFVTLCNGNAYASDDGEWLAELAWGRGTEYYGDGWDIGAHQHAANCLLPEYDFAIFCSTQTHFHREGWLKRMLEARQRCGPGLYGGMASYENRPHLRTCFFGCDPANLRSYPHVINSREKSFGFESGREGFWNWILANDLCQVLVTWDGFYKSPDDWRGPPNIFRRGDQSNCLVWDRHTAVYASETPENKALLERIADGVKS